MGNTESTFFDGCSVPNPPFLGDRRYHVFFSYATEQYELVSKIRACLTRHGYIVCYPDRDFIPGKRVYDNIEEGISQSLKIVLLLSRAFLKSKWCEYEVGLTSEENVIPLHLEPFADEDLPPPYCYPEELRILACRSHWKQDLLNALARSSTNNIRRNQSRHPLGPIQTWSRKEKFHVYFLYRTVSPDKDWVACTVSDLEKTESGLKCGYHERDFIAGKSIISNISTSLESSIAVVIVLTPEFLESHWTKFESDLLRVKQLNGQRVTLLPVLLRDCVVPDCFKDITYLDAQGDRNTWWPRLFLALQYAVDASSVEVKKYETGDRTIQPRFIRKFPEEDTTSSFSDLSFDKNDSLLALDSKNNKLLQFSIKGELKKDVLFDGPPYSINRLTMDWFGVTFPGQEVKCFKWTEDGLDLKNFSCINKDNQKVVLDEMKSALFFMPEKKATFDDEDEYSKGCFVLVVSNTGQPIKRICMDSGSESTDILHFNSVIVTTNVPIPPIGNSSKQVTEKQKTLLCEPRGVCLLDETLCMVNNGKVAMYGLDGQNRGELALDLDKDDTIFSICVSDNGNYIAFGSGKYIYLYAI